MMKIFNYKEDRLPIFIIITYFIADLIVYFSVESIPIFLLWFLLGIWPKGNICAWNHHHQHCYTFKKPIFNRALEVIYGLQTGAIGFVWVLHHNLGHHLNYLDQDKDESRWKKANGETMGRLRYAAEVSLTSYYRAFKVGRKHPKHLKSFLMMSSVTLLIIALLVYFKPLAAITIFIIPMIVSLVLTSDATYVHHHNLDTEDPTKASRNIVDSVWYNRLTGNLGYHTAHHVKFGLHWSKVPKLHEKIKADIPEDCYGQPMVLFLFLDFLSGLFKQRVALKA